MKKILLLLLLSLMMPNSLHASLNAIDIYVDVEVETNSVYFENDFEVEVEFKNVSDKPVKFSDFIVETEYGSTNWGVGSIQIINCKNTSIGESKTVFEFTVNPGESHIENALFKLNFKNYPFPEGYYLVIFESAKSSDQKRVQVSPFLINVRMKNEDKGTD